MSLIWIFTVVSDENIFSLNETIQHSDHENPLLVGYLSETICLKYTAYSCSPGWWIFKPVFAGCFGSSLLDSWACFLHISLLQCPLLTCWISVGSDAFLCSAFTWMQIHKSHFCWNRSHLALKGWGKEPDSSPFPEHLASREHQHQSP